MKKTLYLLNVIDSMDPVSGGPCQGIRYISPELRKVGIVNEVVCMDDPQSSFIGTDWFRVHALGPGKTKWRYSSKLVPWLMENLGRFDMIIVHGLWLFNGFGLRRGFNRYLASLDRSGKKGKSKIPRIFVMPHGMLDPYFQKADSRRIKALRNWFYWHLFERKLIEQANGVLFTCETELTLARKTFSRYTPHREINMGYAVPESPAFSKNITKAFFEVCPELVNKPYLLFLSRIHPKKGVDLLVDAYLKIVQERKVLAQHTPPLVIAGPGMDTVYGKKIQEKIDRSIEGNRCIFFPGMLTGDAKWGAYYSCDAFILPSHQENFGIAVVEALACKKPVLITNQINIWKEIVDGGAGIANDDSASGIYQMMMSWIILSDSQKEKYAQNAFRVFQSKFSLRQSARNLVQLI